MESYFYEYSLTAFPVPHDNSFKKVEIIPRGHVIPEKKIIVKRVTDLDGVSYEEKPLSNWLLFNQLNTGKGLLEKAIPMTIIKRHSFQNWDEFEEIFGIPIRIAKTTAKSESVKKELEESLRQMGSAAYAVFPNNSKYEIIESKQTDAFEVFFKKIQTVDFQLSKLINGQTLTVDEGSSYSLGKTHKETENIITLSDTDDFLIHVNEDLLPFLRMHGFPLDEGDKMFCDYKEQLPMSEKIKVDRELIKYSEKLNFKPTKTYLERTYDIELENIRNNAKG